MAGLFYDLDIDLFEKILAFLSHQIIDNLSLNIQQNLNHLTILNIIGFVTLLLNQSLILLLLPTPV